MEETMTESTVLEVSLVGAEDAPALLEGGLFIFHDLRVSRVLWARLLEAVGGVVPEYLRGDGDDSDDIGTRRVLFAAKAVIDTAVPNPVYPYIQAAKIGDVSRSRVVFVANSGAKVVVSAETVTVHFPHESDFIACHCIDDLVDRGAKVAVLGRKPRRG